MSDEVPKAVEIPGVWKLGWMLFMQPLKLHRLHRALGLGDERRADPRLLTLWPRLRNGDRAVRLLVGRYALWLCVIGPLLALLIAGGGGLLGVNVSWAGVVGGVAGGVAVGVVGGVAVGVAGGLAVGVVLGVAGVVTGVVAGGGLAVGVAFGVVVGVALGVAYGVALGVAFGVAEGAAGGVAVSVAFGVAGGVAEGVAEGVAVGVAVGVAFNLLMFHLPTWPLECIGTRCLASLVHRRRLSPQRIPLLLPFRHHDLIYLPLWGLRDLLVDLARQNQALGREIIDEAAASVGQKTIARDALIELRALELEGAARHDGFPRVADLALPFLPPVDELSPDDPLWTFQAVARDVVAGGANQRLRQQTLDRARARLEEFLTKPRSRRKDPFGHRLQATAGLWLEVVRERIQRLAREMSERPQVPMVFVAGPALRPGTADGTGLFKGRRDLARVLEQDLSPGRRGVMVVIGQRRMGKSSFGHWLPRLLGTGTSVVRVDFQGLGGERHRAHPHRVLVEAIARECPDAPEAPTSDAWGDAMTWLAAVEQRLGDRHLLVVVDEFEKIEEGIREGWCDKGFLDFARAVGDRLERVRFLLLGARPLARLGAHWPDRLISAVVRPLGPLDAEAARELITRPIDDFPAIYPDGAVERILVETGRHPYLIQKVCDDLCQLLNKRGGLRRATAEELDEVFDENASLTLFDELWESRTREERAVLHALAKGDEVARSTALEALVREGFVVREGERGSIAVPMFQRWIESAMPSVTSEAPAPLAPG